MSLLSRIGKQVAWYALKTTVQDLFSGKKSTTTKITQKVVKHKVRNIFK
ncbi:hypothetical protein KL86SPO_50337 [uncultured Sporomusa sp.]|uniref:Uncharacterized protein n=1 Tax=uncultured Sporomusa sp. TaxID=307249 RepID=A0A212LYH7_9FIRM|nr:hypothetical protein [uncultured Sporomusa sp.]SCM82566.1 hypothetical protein KL86SPO_50337 [uncultured Sporomusa sp.]